MGQATLTSLPCIHWIVSHEKFRSMEGIGIQDREAILGANNHRGILLVMLMKCRGQISRWYAGKRC